MAIFNFKNKTKNYTTTTITDFISSFMGTTDKVINGGDGTYFNCINILSQSVGKLDLELIKKEGSSALEIDEQDYKDFMLTNMLNEYETPLSFFTKIEHNRQHYGNAFVFIQRFRRSSKVKLWVLHPTQVQIYIDNAGIFNIKNAVYYLYTDSIGNQYKVDFEDMIHIKTAYINQDGITGIPVKEVLANTIENLNDGNKLISTLYKNGFHSKVIAELTSETANLEGLKKAQSLIEAVAGGVENAGKCIPVPMGVSLKPLDVKLTDAEFTAITKMKALEVASAFGIKPHQLNNLDKSSYSTLEQSQLDFYTNTLNYLLKSIEQEFTFKIIPTDLLNKGIMYKFNVEPLLRGDLNTQVNSYAKAVNNGLLTLNEARAKMGYTAHVDGDILMANSNYTPVNLLKDKALTTISRLELDKQKAEIDAKKAGVSLDNNSEEGDKND